MNCKECSKENPCSKCKQELEEYLYEMEYLNRLQDLFNQNYDFERGDYHY